MKLNIAICDDEQNQSQYIKDIVSAWAETSGHMPIFAEFPSAEAFLFDYAENQNYDILLLDIEMAKMNGIDLAKKVREGNNRVQIVFITGYPDFMSECFEVAALHYLMKPVKKEKLFSVLDRAVIGLAQKEDSLILETDNGIMRVKFSEIMSAEAKGHETLLTLIDKQESVKIGINDLEKQLDDSFVRSHRSYLVGLRHITRITKTDVVLDNDNLIPLSRRMYAEVNQKFIDFYRGEM